jgi:hypothetical protein
MKDADTTKTTRRQAKSSELDWSRAGRLHAFAISNIQAQKGKWQIMLR